MPIIAQVPLKQKMCPTGSEGNGVPTSLTEDGVAAGRLDVLHPRRPRAKHRDQGTVACDGGDHHGGGATLAGGMAADFKDGHLLRRQPEGGPPTRQPVDPAAEARWLPVTLEQSSERAALRWIGRRQVAHGYVPLPCCSGSLHDHAPLLFKASTMSIGLQPDRCWCPALNRDPSHPLQGHHRAERVCRIVLRSRDPPVRPTTAPSPAAQRLLQSATSPHCR
jgi:hypothetical protein